MPQGPFGRRYSRKPSAAPTKQPVLASLTVLPVIQRACLRSCAAFSFSNDGSVRGRSSHCCLSWRAFRRNEKWRRVTDSLPQQVADSIIRRTAVSHDVWRPALAPQLISGRLLSRALVSFLSASFCCVVSHLSFSAATGRPRSGPAGHLFILYTLYFRREASERSCGAPL